MDEETKNQYLRGNNLAGVVICALAGISFLPEIFLEHEIPYKIDDLMLFFIGLVAVFWYHSGRNKFTLSFIPILLTLLGALSKLGAIFTEIKDPGDAGDDFGGTILFVAAFIFMAYLYSGARRIVLKKHEP